MKALFAVLLIFLSVNIGVIYYFIFVGDFPTLERRVNLVERQLEIGGKSESTVDTETESSQATESASIVDEGEVISTISTKLYDEIVDDVARQVRRDLTEEEQLEEQSGFGPINNTIFAEKIPKVYFVPLGQAQVSGSDNQWQDTTLETVFNLADYPGVQQVTFESTLRMPNANGAMKARLYDTETGYVSQSEVSGEGKDGVYIKSNPLQLFEGDRTLRIQLLTTIGDDAVIENARLRVETE